jgi:multicomponent Na+:H+ antiporter subunit F
MDYSISIVVLIIAFSFLLAALVLAFIRLLKGPSINDRHGCYCYCGNGVYCSV